ncbi:hypothetical protein [uncultured Rummeliibacillus sp.]|uniref:hypothetical protein n=1 Tax=uncultured Rummeliibacillus sp. TaxID=762292 RepID=UPI0026171BBC|nr:hypothetical protein [uncultured Rummeliibacillus sp.]
MNRLNFRPQDINAVIKEHNCIDTLKTELSIHVEREEYETARELLKDIDKSLRELSKYRKRKEDHERLLKTVERLQKQGIDLTVVTKCVN